MSDAPDTTDTAESDKADLVELTPAERRTLLRNPHDARVPHSRLNQTVQMLLVVGFVLVMVVGLVFLVADRWRRGTVTVGTGMLVLAALRWIVDGEILGVLSVRSRKFDSLFCAAVGAAMLLVAVSVDALGS
ncbi:MAG: DUF3017 domain-containing protein [Corynebacterium sp.]|uniref:DUF3017 domain-containing protein n=1 Tax=unclassified Corynebacterium TaxID=2624378 RepID=UPI00264758E0|nr:DUF3017 domain-containing protein [Corynebacterium sp.]MDN5582167.1 DUF3017 domain-containing protein [Corynebacterium sp.]MDN5719783.1 DUF3017 domain-containing protein [Corynebacterium sp.]MDN6325496.1 DUF3017 domain-containing protein [Corynebacterium sp.]MDN6387841.1 DUF3017 domain-containing protein [Corynebacterium sp.]MDN6509845.1 DUF3017 domain-containing protein [Corynebacterium sp.]